MPLQHDRLIEIKADIDINPGKEWGQEINQYLEKAQIILLLISSDFIASKHYEKEMLQALVRHGQGTARVVPVILRPCTWQESPLGTLQALPKDAKPVSRWGSADEAYTDIAKGVRSIVQEFIDTPIRESPLLDQSERDGTQVPLFPNSAVRKSQQIFDFPSTLPAQSFQSSGEGKAISEIEEDAVLKTSVKESHMPSLQKEESDQTLDFRLSLSPSSTDKIRSSPSPFRRRKRRAVLLLALTFLLILSSGGTIWSVHAIQTHQKIMATATASASAYNHAISINGTQLGFDAQHSHFNPYERLLSSANVSHLTLAWKAQTGNAVYSAPVVANGVVSIGSADGKLYAFNADGCGQSSCSPLWIAHTGSQIGYAPAVSNGNVLVDSTDGKLYAFNANGCGESSCLPRWTAQIPLSNEYGYGFYLSSPAVANGTVYINTSDSKFISNNNFAYNSNLVAFNASGCGYSLCTFLWKAQIGVGTASLPTIFKGIVYVESNDGKLYAFRANGCGQPTCSPLWTAQVGENQSDTPVIVGGIIYLGADAFNVNGCGQPTCSPLWTADTGDTSTFDAPGLFDPAVANGIVYFGATNQKLYAFNANGCGQHICVPLWSAQTGSAISTSPTIANGIVYIGDKAGTLYAFNANGCDQIICAPLWSTFVEGNSVENVSYQDLGFSDLAVANGVIYVDYDDHNLYAFHLGSFL